MSRYEADAVLDCVVLVQAVRSPSGPSGRVVSWALSGRFRLCISTTTLNELKTVLARPNVLAKCPHLTPEVTGAFVAAIEAVAYCSDTVEEVFSYPRDPKDEPYVNLAIAAKADFLVTRDRDLLDLRNPDDLDGMRLRELHPTLKIVDPVEFLEVLEPIA